MQTNIHEQPKRKFQPRAWIKRDLDLLKRDSKANISKEVQEATHWLEKFQQVLQSQ